jgi:NADPH:quinone reductase-like Zn-dependent oxidoreductase
MKAAVIDRLGVAPHVTACADPSPATGNQVLVKVEAAALNAVDLHIAAGHHRAGPPQLPIGYARPGREWAAARGAALGRDQPRSSRTRGMTLVP